MPLADAVPDPSTLGVAVQLFFYVAGGIGGLLVAAAAVVTIFRSRPAPDQQTVTRAELDKDVNRLDQDIKTLRDYTQNRIHALSNKVHVVNLRLVYLIGLIAQVCRKHDIEVPPMPNDATSDEEP